MNSRRKILTTIIAIVMIFSLACTERIEINLDTTYTRLVVYGEITTENKQQVIMLSSTSDYFYNQPAPAVSEAVVEVGFDSVIIRFEEDNNIPGTYISETTFQGIPGKTYSLNITGVDINQDGLEEVYQANTLMPDEGHVDSVRIAYFNSPFASGYQIFMYARDSPEREWYNYKIYKNGVLLNDTLIKYTVQSDEFFNGQYIYGLPVGFLNDDNPVESAIPGDTIIFELNSITREFYEFIVSAQSEIYGSNPLFGGPPSNVATNLENGALGIFTATALYTISDTIP